MASSGASLLAQWGGPATRPLTVTMRDVDALCERFEKSISFKERLTVNDILLAIAIIRRMKAAHHNSDVLTIPATLGPSFLG